MSFRIYNNPSVLNTQKHALERSKAVQQAFEKVSSGLRVNRAADDPASLVISENMRSKIASIEQAVRNTETDISVLQTAEGSLDEINRSLVHIRQLAVHAANEGANDEFMLLANQNEIQAAIESIDRIVKNTSFGNRKLLDGTSGVGGITTNRQLQFVSAAPETQENPNGYNVVITQTATKAAIAGSAVLEEDMIESGEVLRIMENGRSLEYKTQAGDNLNTVVSKLNSLAERNGLEVTVGLTDSNYLLVRHKKYGSGHSLSVSSTSDGILSDEDGEITQALQGLDVAGLINGGLAKGNGLELTGVEGSEASGLTVRYLGQEGGIFGDEAGEFIDAGSVFIKQNSLVFQLGPFQNQTRKLTINNLNSASLGKGVENISNFDNLQNISVIDVQKATDAMGVVDKAISEIARMRGEIGAVQKNDLESNLRSLQTWRENITAAESVIRDTDYAVEMSNLIKNQVIMNASTSVLMQNNNNMKSVLSLMQ